MRLERPHFLPALLITCTLIGGCGLLSQTKSDSMSSAELANINLQMGVRYLNMGMLDVAKEKLENAYDLDSSNPETLNALAVFYERIKDDEEAADFYQAAIRNDPENYSTKNNYGRFLCEHGQPEKGMAMLQEALDSPMNQRSWLALTNIGLCRLQQNDAGKAEQNFREALFVNPEYAPALQEMLKISYNKQEYMSARAFLERYQAVAKPTAQTLWYGFQTERAMGNRQAAENLKEQLIMNFPTSSEALEVKSAISK